MKNILNKFKNKRILILGFGREGTSTYKFIRKYLPELKIYIADRKQIKLPKDKYLTAYFGENYLDNLTKFDLIIKTPGISSQLPQIKDCIENGIEVTSQTQLFLNFFKEKTIGITGTKGKSTTTSLIYHILNKAGIKAQIVGNIGKPVLDYVNGNSADDIFVFEMSSHQLSDIKESPHIAVFLNIYPEHLDYYSDFEKYLLAKTNIFKHQTNSDVFIFNSDQDEIISVSKLSPAKKFSFSMINKVINGCFLNDDKIVIVEDNVQNYLFNLDEIKLQGKHNLYNIMAAIISTKVLGVNFSDIADGIVSFNPLEDRLEIVEKINGITFVNDSLATIPQATIAAVESYKDREITLILGGFDRGVSFEEFGKDISGKKSVLNIITIGQTGPKIEKALKKNMYKGNLIGLGNASMDEIVKKAYEVSPKGGIVLLSPASTSFDMFNDYKDRGDQFKKAVVNIKK